MIDGFYAPINPMGKPRMTRSDKWKKRPAVVAYRAFADGLRYYAKGFKVPDSNFSLSFEMPMPPSWSQKKRAEMDGKPHQQKPDIDNLIKAVLDALCEEDCTIWQIAGAEKRWSETGAIKLEAA